MNDHVVSGEFSRTVCAENLVPRQKLLYGREEASELLSISIRALDYLTENKELNVVRIGRRVLISHQELQRFARRDHYSVKQVN